MRKPSTWDKRAGHDIDGNVLLFAHSHFLRVFAACRLGLNPEAERYFFVGIATLNIVGNHHGLLDPVIYLWDDCRHAMTNGAGEFPVREGRTTSPAEVFTPARFDAVLFDLDGVVTRTARVHAAAWKLLFDQYREERLRENHPAYPPFDVERDYLRYVDGKPRYDGVQSFLASRGIHIPYGEANDPPDKETVCGLGNRKNRLFLEQLEQVGVQVYDSTVRLIRQLRESGIKTAIVSASKNCSAALHAANLKELFDAQVDGVVAQQLQLKGKPAPDMFLEAARRLGVVPTRAAVVEDATSGVRAGQAGGFGLVIGVDRGGNAESLRQNGADVVVSDLAEAAVIPEGGRPQ